MKRFHVHLHVADIGHSIGFYSKLFGAEPARIESDYAKWMLDDPALNFAISTRGAAPGIDHLGFQTDDPAELAALKARAEAAELAPATRPPSARYAAVHWPRPGASVQELARQPPAVGVWA